MKSMQEENRFAKKNTQIVIKGKRGEVRIANNNGLYVVFPKTKFKYKHVDPLKTQKWSH